MIVISDFCTTVKLGGGGYYGGGGGSWTGTYTEFISYTKIANNSNQLVRLWYLN